MVHILTTLKPLLTHCHDLNPENNQNHQISVFVTLKRHIKYIHFTAKKALVFTLGGLMKSETLTFTQKFVKVSYEF